MSATASSRENELKTQKSMRISEPDAILDEDHILNEAIEMASQSATNMKNAMQECRLRDVLIHSATLISELRTSALGFQAYYKLYTYITNELNSLIHFFLNSLVSGKQLSKLYESVQQAGKLLPRLYLLLIVGTVCIVKEEMSATLVLKDFMELCKGVQHPLRGLFLRNFVLKMFKEHIVIKNSKHLNPENNVVPVVESVQPDGEEKKEKYVLAECAKEEHKEINFEFLCCNYLSALKFWRRFFHMNALFKNMKPEVEGFYFGNFVASNILIMEQCNCVSRKFFRKVAFSQLFESIISCKEAFLQQYIVKTILHVFDAECLIEALEGILKSICSLPSCVNIPEIISGLCVKLQSYFAENQLSFQENDVIKKQEPETFKDEAIETDQEKDFDAVLEKKHLEKKINSNIPIHHEDLDDLVTLCPETNVQPAVTETNESKENQVDDSGRPLKEKSEEEVLMTQFSMINLKPVEAPVDQVNSLDLDVLEKKSAEDPEEKINAHIDTNVSVGKDKVVANYEKANHVFLVLKQGLMDLIILAHTHEYADTVVTTSGQPYKSTRFGFHTQVSSSLTYYNLLSLLESFLLFTLNVFETKLDLADSVFQLIKPVLLAMQQHKETTSLEEDKQVLEEQIVPRLFSHPLTFPGYIKLFHTSMYSYLLGELNDKNKLLVFGGICQALVSSNTMIDTLHYLETILSLGAQHKPSLPEEETRFPVWIKFYSDIAKIIHLVSSHDINVMYMMLTIMYKFISSKSSESYQITFPTFIFKSVQLFLEIHTLDVSKSKESSQTEQGPEISSSKAPPLDQTPIACIKPKQVIQLIHSACTTLMEAYPEIGYRITLNATEAIGSVCDADSRNYENIVIEFLRQSLTCYEDLLTKNKSHVNALIHMLLVVVSVQSVVNRETYETLAETLTRHAAKLLSKSEQCVGILRCTHLFWSVENSEKSNVLRLRECLERSLKIVLDSLQYSANSIHLLVKVLDTYLYFFEKLPTAVPAKTVSNLLSLCWEQVEYFKETEKQMKTSHENIQQAEDYLNNIIQYIALQKGHEDTRYVEISVEKYVVKTNYLEERQ